MPIVAKPADKRTPKEKDELFAAWLVGSDEPYKELTAELAKRQAEEKAIKSRGAATLVMTSGRQPAMAYILNRGEYDKRKDKVTPDVPKSLPPMPSRPAEESARLREVAVAAGASADGPRHGQSLLAGDVRHRHRPHGGRLRRAGRNAVASGIARLAGRRVPRERLGHQEVLQAAVTSATYRQAATLTPEKMEKDPQNRLLSRGPRFRMDAEMVRDYALAASGLLVHKLGGPSVKPYQPDGVWEAVAMIGSNTRDYRKDTGDKLYRRSMYTFWKRSAPPASMDIFNAPSREICTVRRERTNTPLQALVTLNDPQFVEAARVLAEKALKEGGAKAEEKIDFIARRLLARPFTPPRWRSCEASLTRPCWQITRQSPRMRRS